MAIFWSQTIIQLINQRDAGGDVDSYDIFIAYVIKMFDQSTDAVPMGGDQNLFAPHHRRASR